MQSEECKMQTPGRIFHNSKQKDRGPFPLCSLCCLKTLDQTVGTVEEARVQADRKNAGLRTQGKCDTRGPSA